MSHGWECFSWLRSLTCTLISLSLSFKGISLSSKFEKFECETRAEHFQKFSKGKLSRFNEYFINFALKLKIFFRLFWKERCRTVEGGKREGLEANKTDFKESSSN